MLSVSGAAGLLLSMNRLISGLPATMISAVIASDSATAMAKAFLMPLRILEYEPAP